MHFFSTSGILEQRHIGTASIISPAKPVASLVASPWQHEMWWSSIRDYDQHKASVCFTLYRASWVNLLSSIKVHSGFRHNETVIRDIVDLSFLFASKTLCFWLFSDQISVTLERSTNFGGPTGKNIKNGAVPCSRFMISTFSGLCLTLNIWHNDGWSSFISPLKWRITS